MARNTIATSEIPGHPPEKSRAFQDGTNIEQAVDMLNEHAAALDTLDSKVTVTTALGVDSVKVAAAADKLGFYGATPVALQTGVTVDVAGIHAALVALGLITA